MIVQFEMMDAISAVATILSVAGSLIVTSLDIERQMQGYWIWFVSNLIWILYFGYMDQWWPCLLFATYFIITIIGLSERHAKLTENEPIYEDHY